MVNYYIENKYLNPKPLKGLKHNTLVIKVPYRGPDSYRGRG
jgi:hypothetical protein